MKAYPHEVLEDSLKILQSMYWAFHSKCADEMPLELYNFFQVYPEAIPEDEVVPTFIMDEREEEI